MRAVPRMEGMDQVNIEADEVFPLRPVPPAARRASAFGVCSHTLCRKDVYCHINQDMEPFAQLLAERVALALELASANS